MEQVLQILLTRLEEHSTLLPLGILLLLSFAGGQAANYFKAPRVVGYLVAGILAGSSVSKTFHDLVFRMDLSPITHMALAIIAFSIGGSLELTKIKRLGRQILWITLSQGFCAFLLSTAALGLFLALVECSGRISPCFFTQYFPMALVVGAISMATAPAATLAIVHEYRAKGPFTTILLGVVALDDGLTLFVYAFAVNIAYSIVNNNAVSIHQYLLAPALSLAVSLSVGAGMGLFIRALARKIHSREIMLGVILGGIFLTGSLADAFSGHALMANMMLGFMIINFSGQHNDVFGIVEGIEEPIFGMFFAVAGAHFDFGLIRTAGLIALVISIGRLLGKVLGSRLGARISHAPPLVKKHLGFALLPTAGVTIGLVFDAWDTLGSNGFSETMVTGVLGSVLLNEFLTPFFLKASLKHAGEMQVQDTRAP